MKLVCCFSFQGVLLLEWLLFSWQKSISDPHVLFAPRPTGQTEQEQASLLGCLAALVAKDTTAAAHCEGLDLQVAQRATMNGL